MKNSAYNLRTVTFVLCVVLISVSDWLNAKPLHVASAGFAPPEVVVAHSYAMAKAAPNSATSKFVPGTRDAELR
jgi:hypothetical protein